MIVHFRDVTEFVSKEKRKQHSVSKTKEQP